MSWMLIFFLLMKTSFAKYFFREGTPKNKRKVVNKARVNEILRKMKIFILLVSDWLPVVKWWYNLTMQSCKPFSNNPILYWHPVIVSCGGIDNQTKLGLSEYSFTSFWYFAHDMMIDWKLHNRGMLLTLASNIWIWKTRLSTSCVFGQ